MAKTSSASKIVLNGFNDLFGMTDSENKVTEVRDVMIDELFEFKNHPFKVRDNAKMDELVESIKEHGVLQALFGILHIKIDIDVERDINYIRGFHLDSTDVK